MKTLVSVHENNVSQVYDPTRIGEEYPETNVSQYVDGFDYSDYETSKLYANEAKEWAEKSEASAEASCACAERAEIAATNSEDSAQSSLESATKASEHAVSAGISAGSAILAAAYAANSKNIAQGHVEKAKAEADRATQEAIKSEASASRSQSYASLAETSATNAAESEKNAKDSETKANTVMLEAANYANSAQVDAAAAARAEKAAQQSATEADSSATQAALSQQAALASEQAAKISETNAKVSEVASKASETNAKTSEINAKTSETNAKGYETSASADAAEVRRIYEEFQKGIDYGGVWEITSTTTPYPSPVPTVNTAYDVVTPNGDPITAQGKTWQSGDRLIYSVKDSTWYQIDVPHAVTSVNGLTGAVVLDWKAIGGNSYIISDGGRLRMANWLRAAGTSSGFLPRNAGTGDASVSVIGTDSEWFKESWVNTYKGGSVDVSSVNVNGSEVFSPSNKPTWGDASGLEYFENTTDGGNQITKAKRWVAASSDTTGFLPSTSGSGSGAKSNLGTQSYQFKEAWVNSYRGGSVDVSGVVKGTTVNIDDVVVRKSGANELEFVIGGNVVASISDSGVFDHNERVFSPVNLPTTSQVTGTIDFGRID